jgi:hypothetical protein
MCIFEFLLISAYRHKNEHGIAIDDPANVPGNVPAPLQNVVEPAGVAAPNLLAPHDQIWVPLPHGEHIIDDPTAEYQWGPAPRINWGNNHVDPIACRPIDYFNVLFPMTFFRERLIPATNENMQELNAAVATPGEMLRFHGILLAMALDPVHGGIETYWDATNPTTTCVLGRDFHTRFGMSRDRFLRIKRCLQCGVRSEHDPWSEIRPFIEAFNNNRKESVRPGLYVVVDEVMSFWEGDDITERHDGLPHRSVELRKPRDRGTEFKAICDGKSNIMLGLEMLEGKERMQVKEHCAQFGPATACTMRLASPYRGTRRIVIGDSWFASMKTVKALMDMNLFFIGIVKNGHTKFPRKYLLDWASHDRNTNAEYGNWKVCRAFEDTAARRPPGDPAPLYRFPITALCWNDVAPKLIVSSCGRTDPHPQPYVRKRTRVTVDAEGLPATERFDRETPRPRLIADLFQYFGAIDRHDHMRQGVLRVEEAWKTKIWWHRLYATVFGIVVTDCYFAYKYVRESLHAEATDFFSFCDALAIQLVKNADLVEADQRQTRGAAAIARGEPIPGVRTPEGRVHKLVQINRLQCNNHEPGVKQRFRRRCKVCTRPCSWYCVECSAPYFNLTPQEQVVKKRQLFAICGMETGRDCFTRHHL